MANILDDEARANVRKIIEGAAAGKPAPGSVEQKIGDYFASFMDTARIETAGINALKADLDRIAAVKTASELARLFGEPGFQSPVGAYVGPDDKDPDAYFVNLVQSGLGMPDRDYYLKDDPKLKEARAAYLAHIGRMLTLAGVSDASAKAARIMALETKIAQAHWAAERTRDAIANYNPKPRAEIATFAPGLDWQAMFDAMEVGGWDRFNANTPTALKGIAALVDVAAARRLEGVPHLSPRPQPCAVPAEGDRRRELRVLRQDLVGTPAAARALGARRRSRQWRAGRSHRPGLREAALPAGVEGQDRCARRQPAGRLQGQHREPHVDGPRDPRQGAREAGGAARRRSAIRPSGRTTRR